MKKQNKAETRKQAGKLRAKELTEKSGNTKVRMPKFQFGTSISTQKSGNEEKKRVGDAQGNQRTQEGKTKTAVRGARGN